MRVPLSMFGGIAVLCAVTAPAPASPKPCRTADGRIIPCAKQAKPAPVRCKDEKGRFAPCRPAPAAAPR